MAPLLRGVYSARPAASDSWHVHSASSTWIDGTPGIRTATSRRRRVRRSGSTLGRELAEQLRERRARRRRARSARRAAAGARRPPPGARRRCAGRRPGSPLDGAGVERVDRDARVEQREQQRVGERPAAAVAALDEPRERRLLDRRARRVGIDADVAEEHAVGRGNRLAPQLDGARRRASARPAAASRSRLPGVGRPARRRRRPRTRAPAARGTRRRASRRPGPARSAPRRSRAARRRPAVRAAAASSRRRAVELRGVELADRRALDAAARAAGSVICGHTATP